MKQISFCGGLPRTGSTMLMSILQQNPKVFTTSTCPTPHIIFNVVTRCRNDNTFMAMDQMKADQALYGLVHGGVQEWFNSLTEKPFVISKNRVWSDVCYLFPENKFIYLVRDLRDIFDSFLGIEERFKSLKTFDKHTYKIVSSMSHDQLFNFYFEENGVIDFSIQSIINLIETRKNIMFIRYEDLISFPEKTLYSLYEYLMLQPYEHDLQNIQPPQMYEHDSLYSNERVIHEVHSSLNRDKINIKSRKMPNHFYDKIIGKYNWFYEKFYPEIL